MTNAVRSIQTLRLMTIGALGLMALMISEPSFAGTGGDAFTDVWDTLKDWTQGTLGRIVAEPWFWWVLWAVSLAKA